MRALTFSFLSLVFGGCATKQALSGSLGDYMDLPLAQPALSYTEALCPGEEVAADAPTGTDVLFLTEEGAVWTWSGNDSAYITEHDFGQWDYTQDDPAVKQWLALAGAEPSSGGRGIFYIE